MELQTLSETHQYHGRSLEEAETRGLSPQTGEGNTSGVFDAASTTHPSQGQDCTASPQDQKSSDYVQGPLGEHPSQRHPRILLKASADCEGTERHSVFGWPSELMDPTPNPTSQGGASTAPKATKQSRQSPKSSQCTAAGSEVRALERNGNGPVEPCRLGDSKQQVASSASEQPISPLAQSTCFLAAHERRNAPKSCSTSSGEMSSAEEDCKGQPISKPPKACQAFVGQRVQGRPILKRKQRRYLFVRRCLHARGRARDDKEDFKGPSSDKPHGSQEGDPCIRGPLASSLHARQPAHIPLHAEIQAADAPPFSATLRKRQPRHPSSLQHPETARSCSVETAVGSSESKTHQDGLWTGGVCDLPKEPERARPGTEESHRKAKMEASKEVTKVEPTMLMRDPLDAAEGEAPAEAHREEEKFLGREILEQYLRPEEAEEFMKHTDLAGHGKINDLMFQRAVLHIYSLRKRLVRALKSQASIASTVLRMMSLLLWFVTMIALLLVMGIEMNTVVMSGAAFLSAITVSLSYIYQHFITAVIFVAFTNPYNIGDRVRVDGGDILYVRRIRTYTTEFESMHGKPMIYSNATLFTRVITNESRAKVSTFELTVSVSVYTAPVLLKALEQEMRRYVKSRAMDFVKDSFRIVIYEVHPGHWMQMGIWLTCVDGWGNWTKVLKVRSEVCMYLVKILTRLRISFHLPQQPIAFTKEPMSFPGSSIKHHLAAG
ncbi:uncharacterized protein LOC34618726 [Cyclospora cayetanensis]|uniref:Uncharacterized protein LOC34618726 n=1 Tax=Cyclospora cayetanensis TaxID=88456 RepID=A0A6P6S1D8_9EIME|nr:uncharacterized protein LOC34618726 [Cyclospora cayetanensis]